MYDGLVRLSYGDEKRTYASKGEKRLGTPGVLPDGRVFYYAQAGATALNPNVLVQMKVGLVGHNVSLTPSTSIGDWSTSAAGIPIGSASIGVVWVTGKDSGEYVDGYMTVETTPGAGMYRIAQDNDSGSSSTVTVIRLAEDDTLQIAALTTVSKLAFTPNPYTSLIVAQTTLTGVVMGVTPVNVPISYYFWLQTAGPAAVRYNDLVAAVVGEKVVGGVGATAGDAVGMPKTTVTTTAAINTTLNPLAYTSRPTIGYALEGIPDDGDLLKVMLTIRGL